MKLIQVTVNSVKMYINIESVVIESMLETKDGKAVICLKEGISVPDNEVTEEEDVDVTDVIFVEESFSEVISMLEAKL